jgi:hypothetical protein
MALRSMLSVAEDDDDIDTLVLYSRKLLTAMGGRVPASCPVERLDSTKADVMRYHAYQLFR